MVRDECADARELIQSSASRWAHTHRRAGASADAATDAQSRVNVRHQSLAAILTSDHADRLVGAIHVALLTAGAAAFINEGRRRAGLCFRPGPERHKEQTEHEDCGNRP